MPDENVDFYAFDRYRLDVRSRRLLRDGEPVTDDNLTAKVFEVLLVLVRSHGQLVTRLDLERQVWGGRQAQANLGNCINKLRKIFGETAGENRFIINIHGEGYQFIPRVTADLPSSTHDVSAVPSEAADIAGTWVSTDFNFRGDVIKATFEFKRYGTVIAGRLLRTQSHKHHVNIEGGISDVNIDGENVTFIVMMDVYGMHAGPPKYPLKFAGSFSGESLHLAALWEDGPTEFIATRVSSLPNRR